jgi:hypothetical protein
MRAHPAGGVAMSKDWDNAPDWLTDERYAYLRSLPLAGWQYELQRCAWLLEDANAGQWNERPPVPGHIGAPVVQLVHKGDVTLHRLEKPVLIVQLDAPDGVLIKKFIEALKLARKTYPSPVKKPGPDSSNAEFTERKISSWLNYKIVPLAELENWRLELKKKNCMIPAEDFGRWLFAGHAGPSKELVTARNELIRAIGNIPALWAQIEGATSEFITSN